jgi:hypothetical protein
MEHSLGKHFGYLATSVIGILYRAEAFQEGFPVIFRELAIMLRLIMVADERQSLATHP